VRRAVAASPASDSKKKLTWGIKSVEMAAINQQLVQRQEQGELRLRKRRHLSSCLMLRRGGKRREIYER